MAIVREIVFPYGTRVLMNDEAVAPDPERISRQAIMNYRNIIYAKLLELEMESPGGAQRAIDAVAHIKAYSWEQDK